MEAKTSARSPAACLLCAFEAFSSAAPRPCLRHLMRLPNVWSERFKSLQPRSQHRRHPVRVSEIPARDFASPRAQLCPRHRRRGQALDSRSTSLMSVSTGELGLSRRPPSFRQGQRFAFGINDGAPRRAPSYSESPSPASEETCSMFGVLASGSAYSPRLPVSPVRTVPAWLSSRLQLVRRLTPASRCLVI